MASNKPIIIASGPVIIENEKVLLNKHGDDDFWKFVGGRVENYGSSLRDVAKLEAKNEMGIDVQLTRVLEPMMIEFSDKIVILTHYLANRRGEISPRADIKEWNWFDIHNLPEDIAPNIEPIITEYLRTKNN